MAIRQQLEKLASETGSPCVTISFNTHRTRPDNAQDIVRLKNMLKEAEKRVTDEFGKRPAARLLERIAKMEEEIDSNQNLDSLHIFLSDHTREVIRSPWPVHENEVHISDTFALRPLIKDYTRGEEYLVMLLSQGGVQLYDALNDSISSEIRNDDFPFAETPHYITNAEKASDGKQVDNMVREFFNRVDKALVRVHNETGLQCVVICTENNYSRLIQVADRPSVYHGYVPVDYNNTAPHQIARQAWGLIERVQFDRRTKAISEMQEAVAQGLVLTDLQEIYQAAIDGRADLLIIRRDFAQPVRMTGDRTFTFIDDKTKHGTVEDITSHITWQVLSRKGRVVFTSQEQLQSLGAIALKTRY